MESAGDCENIRMKRLFKRITALASAAALTLSLAACGGSAVSGPKNTAPTKAKPVSITVWTYYNGDQLETFSKLVDEFNATVGKEQNITVEASSQGSVNDLETNVLAYVGSNSSATFFPKQVQVSDTESHDISLKVLPNPSFAGSEEVAVQQGAGMVVTKSTPEEEAACVTFLKWFTQPENNIQFAVGSGYLPVTHAADDMTAIENSGLDLTDSMKDVLANAIDAVENHELYTPKPFAGGTDARKVLEYSMSDLASADRAAVEEQIAAGVSAAEAEALYLTDEYFENWYQSLCTKLSAYEG